AAAAVDASPTAPRKQTGRASAAATAVTVPPVASLSSPGAVAALVSANIGVRSDLPPLITPPPLGGFTPPSTRPHVWREVPRDCRRSFTGIILPYFSAYRQHSVRDERIQCERIVNYLLDMPAL